MKFPYTAVLFFFASQIFSQTSQIGPVQGNPQLRSHAAKEEVRLAKQAQRLTGVNPLEQSLLLRNAGECPPEIPFDLIVVESGSSISIELDTFGLGQSVNDPVLTLLNATPLQFGAAALLDSSIIVEYTAFTDFFDLGTDSVQIEFSDDGGKDTITVEITVKRKGRTEVAPTQFIGQEEVVMFCLDDLLGFSSPEACTEIIPCVDNYPGNGDQLVHLAGTQSPDSCLVYYASRFIGVDTVCVRMCDSLAVCDVFKIPFRIVGDTLSLSAANPFFDDFSSYRGPYPTRELWLDRDVFVNNTLAPDPPSIGMATFDGLNRKGQPYPIVNPSIGDQLTSKPIDLSGFTPADVLSLRYFVAPKGYGQGPEVADSLTVEFKNSQGNWIKMDGLPGANFGIYERPPFQLRGIPVNQGQFLHSSFQFRFSARTSPGGYGDWWHVDYVYLGAVAADNSNFSDIALTEVPTTFLKNNTSMPWDHFQANVDGEVTEQFDAHFYNHFPNPTTISPSAVNYVELTQGVDFNQDFTIVELGENILPGEPTVRQGTIPATNFGQIKETLSTGIADDDLLIVETSYVISNGNQVGPAGYFTNDTTRLRTVFSNYFAHDDGTAELQYFVTPTLGGEQIATRYRTNVADTLRAVQFMFPHYTIGDLENQLFTLKVWVGSLDNEPVFERELLRPFFADAVYDTLQGFTTYKLENILGEETPVGIPADTAFFVGWEYGSNAALGFPVGLDLQHPCECNFTDLLGFGWTMLSPELFPGSLMIRPVMGAVPFNTSSPAAEVARVNAPVEIFPNPTSGVLNLRFENGNPADFKLLVFNQLGQLVRGLNAASEHDLGDLENGFYYLQISDLRSGQHFVKRFVVSK